MNNLLRLIIIINLLILFDSCNEDKSDNKKEKKIISKKDTLTIKPSINKKEDETKNFYYENTDTLIVYKKCAVCYSPTKKQIEDRKEAIGVADFYTGSDDYLFYMNEAQKSLNNHSYPIVVTEKKYLKFISNNNITIIDKEKNDELWGIYIFNENKKPKLLDMVDIENELSKY